MVISPHHRSIIMYILGEIKNDYLPTQDGKRICPSKIDIPSFVYFIFPTNIEGAPHNYFPKCVYFIFNT